MWQCSTLCGLIIAFSLEEASPFSPLWQLLLTALSQSKSCDGTLINRVNSGIVMLSSFTFIRIIPCLGLKSVILVHISKLTCLLYMCIFWCMVLYLRYILIYIWVCSYQCSCLIDKIFKSSYRSFFLHILILVFLSKGLWWRLSCTVLLWNGQIDCVFIALSTLPTYLVYQLHTHTYTFIEAAIYVCEFNCHWIMCIWFHGI